MSEEAEKIEKGLVISKRTILNIGSSKAVTFPKSWLDIQKWLGNDTTEIVAVANEMIIVFVPPEKEELAKQFVRKFGQRLKKITK